MNHNILTERALRDVFSTTSYISIGTKDAPLDYGQHDSKYNVPFNQWHRKLQIKRSFCCSNSPEHEDRGCLIWQKILATKV
jgi:hypothetical protein